MGAAHMQLTHDSKAGLPNTYNALVYVTFCVGSYLFTMGCFLMTVPVINEARSSHPRPVWKYNDYICWSTCVKQRARDASASHTASSKAGMIA